MTESSAPYVCRPSDSAALRAHFDVARAGQARVVVLEAPLGGGKRAVVGDMVRGLGAEDEILVVRSAITDEEDGLRCLFNVYAALYGALFRSPALAGKVEAALNLQLAEQPGRVQRWFQAFIEGLKKGGPAEGEKTFQLTIPRDNPLAGFVEILAGISRRIPTIFEIQNLHNSHSVATYAMLEGLLERTDSKLLLVLETELAGEHGRTWMPGPWLDLLDRRADALQRMVIAPWGEEEVAAYLSSKGLSAHSPARIAEIAGGRPAYVAELVDVLAEKDQLGSDLDGETLSSLAPLDVDADELDEPAEKPAEGQRRHAGADDADRILYVCALLGLTFPSGLVADMAGYERDSVDDLLDACPGAVAELQFSKPLGTWVYQFKKAIWRQAVLDGHTTQDDRNVGQRVALFMERFLVPRGYEFLVKTLRMYAENGAMDRANALRGAALAADPPDVWSMTHDLLSYLSGVTWPDPMRRAVYSHLLDRMSQAGDPDQAERLYQEALKWATDHNDPVMEGWVRFAGSRLDFRRQDLYRGRDRAKDALRVFTALGDKMKSAEAHNHLALIEFQDGSINAAMDHLRNALELANVPPIQANVEFIRGLIAQRGNKIPEASEHFRKANEVAGNIGMAPLALESGFKYGETLFLQRDFTKAADILLRVAQIAQSLRNGLRERSALALLTQCHGALRNHEAALQTASRTLQLSQELRLEQAMAADIFQVGFYNLQLGRPTEAISLFGKAKERTGSDNPGLLRELAFHTGVAALQIGEKGTAASALRDAANLARQTKEWRRAVQALENLAVVDVQRGDKTAARKHLEEALQAADLGKLAEERKTIQKRMKELGS